MKDKDDFWNIDRILPKGNSVPNKPTRVVTTEISTGSAHISGVDVRMLFSVVNEKRSVNSLESSIAKECDYEYFNDSRVISYAYVGKYSNVLSYDNRIRMYALRYFDKSGNENAEFVEYFSFKPNFSELSAPQLEYYLSWRSCVRRKLFFKTSPSYVLLLVTEIVNLPDKILPKEGIDLIISLFLNCLEDASKFERIISDILFEYCVVHNIPIPYEKIAPIIYTFKNPITNIIGSLFVFDHLLVGKNNFSEEFSVKFVKANPDLEELEYLYKSDMVNLRQAVNEIIMLNEPQLIYCKENCKGLCPICGSNLNEKDCGCKY